MQLLSLALATPPDPQRLLDDLTNSSMKLNAGAIATFALITLVLCIVAAWVAAQAVLKEGATVGRAVRTGFAWFMGFALALLLAGTAWYFALLRGSALMATVSIAIGGVLLLYTALNSPVKSYKISFLKALGFAAVGIIVLLAAELAVQKAMGDPLKLQARYDQVGRLAALSPEAASKLLVSMKKQTAAPVIAAATPAPVAGVTPKTPEPTPAPPKPPKPQGRTIAERHDELKKVYADLMAQRESLREGEDDALAAYQRDTAKYVEKLTQLQKDADAAKK